MPHKLFIDERSQENPYSKCRASPICIAMSNFYLPGFRVRAREGGGAAKILAMHSSAAGTAGWTDVLTQAGLGAAKQRSWKWRWRFVSADEPTGSRDQESVKEVLALLRNCVKEEGVTALLARASAAVRACPRSVCTEEGRRPARAGGDIISYGKAKEGNPWKSESLH
jgi:hypothetical protein